MKTLPASVAATALVLSFAAAARADMIAPSWANIVGPTWSGTASFSSPGFNGWNTNYSSTWELTNPQTLPYNGAQYYLLGGATLPLSVLNPSYNHVPYTAQLTLYDNKTNTSGSLTFAGVLNGGPPNITNTITGPSEQSLNLGGDHFAVTFIPFLPTFKAALLLPTGWTEPPYPPQWSFGNPSQGGIYASIMENGKFPAPEPSSLILACLGLPSLGWAGWFRRQRRRKIGSWKR